MLEGAKEMDWESFLALLTERPQHLKDTVKRRLVEGLLKGGSR